MVQDNKLNLVHGKKRWSHILNKGTSALAALIYWSAPVVQNYLLTQTNTPKSCFLLPKTFNVFSYNSVCEFCPQSSQVAVSENFNFSSFFFFLFFSWVEWNDFYIIKKWQFGNPYKREKKKGNSDLKWNESEA